MYLSKAENSLYTPKNDRLNALYTPKNDRLTPKNAVLGDPEKYYMKLLFLDCRAATVHIIYCRGEFYISTQYRNHHGKLPRKTF